MGTLFQLAPVTRVTASSTQAITDVVDVLAYGGFDAGLQMFEASGASPSIQVQLQTSTQNESDADDLWLSVGTFDTVTTPNKLRSLSASTGLLRYLRWKIALGVDTTACTFSIVGIGRAG